MRHQLLTTTLGLALLTPGVMAQTVDEDRTDPDAVFRRQQLAQQTQQRPQPPGEPQGEVIPQEQVNDAMRRLQERQAAREGRSSAASDASSASTDVAQLRQEVQRLQSELESAQRENQALQDRVDRMARDDRNDRSTDDAALDRAQTAGGTLNGRTTTGGSNPTTRPATGGLGTGVDANNLEQSNRAQGGRLNDAQDRASRPGNAAGAGPGFNSGPNPPSERVRRGETTDPEPVENQGLNIRGEDGQSDLTGERSAPGANRTGPSSSNTPAGNVNRGTTGGGNAGGNASQR